MDKIGKSSKKSYFESRLDGKNENSFKNKDVEVVKVISSNLSITIWQAARSSEVHLNLKKNGYIQIKIRSQLFCNPLNR
jgi:hypothetical protein